MPTFRNFPYHINAVGGITGMNNVGGATYYVGASGYLAALGGIAPSDSNKGTSPQSPFATIQKGLDSCTAGRGDIVAVLPGSYTITAALTMTKDDVSLISALPVGPREYPPVTIVCATDVSEVEVNANNITIAGIRFDDNVTAATASTAVIDVNTASTATDYSGFKAINCWLDMAGMTDSDKDGITLGTDADDGALSSLVEGCTIIEAGRDGIVVNVGSEFTEIRNCKIYDATDTTDNGIEVLATSVTVDNCDILVSGTACVHNGVAAARLVVDDCRLHAWGANTIGILAINTATQRTSGNWVTATAAGNLIDYTTDNTTPSADAFISNIFAANAGITVMGETTVGGADA